MSLVPLPNGLAPDLVERLESGIDVLDVGCGAGRALILLAELFPCSRFTGYDFSVEAVGKARAEAERRGLGNLCFEVRDVSRLGDSRAFDLITAFDAIHDQRDPARVLAEIHAALRDDGTFLMQEIAASTHLENNLEHPVGPFLYTISTGVVSLVSHTGETATQTGEVGTTGRAAASADGSVVAFASGASGFTLRRAASYASRRWIARTMLRR